jgi:hypothetical protein
VHKTKLFDSVFFYEFDNINDELEKIDDRINCSPKRQRSLLIIDELYMYQKKNYPSIRTLSFVA